MSTSAAFESKLAKKILNSVTRWEQDIYVEGCEASLCPKLDGRAPNHDRFEAEVRDGGLDCGGDAESAFHVVLQGQGGGEAATGFSQAFRIAVHRIHLLRYRSVRQLGLERGQGVAGSAAGWRRSALLSISWPSASIIFASIESPGWATAMP